MTGFFKDVNLVYIIGIISALIGGVWAFYRFVYEKKLERFKEASTNLFVGDENQVLAAVAHLGVFKKDMFFKRNTVAVLLTKLYRELRGGGSGFTGCGKNFACHSEAEFARRICFSPRDQRKADSSVAAATSG